MGILLATKFCNFSEISNTINMHSIKEIEKKKVPINLLSMYLSSILSIDLFIKPQRRKEFSLRTQRVIYYLFKIILVLKKLQTRC